MFKKNEQDVSFFKLISLLWNFLLNIIRKKLMQNKNSACCAFNWPFMSVVCIDLHEKESLVWHLIWEPPWSPCMPCLSLNPPSVTLKLLNCFCIDGTLTLFLLSVLRTPLVQTCSTECYLNIDLYCIYIFKTVWRSDIRILTLGEWLSIPLFKRRAFI